MADNPSPIRRPSADYSPGASTPRPAPPRRHRGLRLIAWLVAALLAVLVTAGAGLWWWTGGSTSLATALARASQYLPPEQRLESRDVTGSLRRGGHIGWLRWSSPALTVEVSDLTLGWSLAPLLQRRLELGDVHAARVLITPRAPDPAKPEESPQPPTELVLPLRVGLAFQVDQLDWAGPTAVQVRGLAGDYQFDGQAHRLNVASVEVAQGSYTAQATLQALAPLAVQARVEGSVQTQPPGGGTPQKVAAQATLDGTLATTAARLHLQARLSPVVATAAGVGPGTGPPSTPAGTPSAATAPMRADVDATLTPWTPQPLRSATATLHALDLAALWPQAPVTQLHGTVSAGPSTGNATRATEGWSVQAELRNELAGPWDQRRLPMAALQADARYDGVRWTVPAATLTVGAGTATLAGQYTPATGAVEGQLEVRNIPPAAVHTALEAAPLSGRVRAQMQESAVQFNADIRAAGTAAVPRPAVASRGGAGKRAPARIQLFTAQGSWHPMPSKPDAADTTANPAPANSTLRLQRLAIDALQARLEATDLTVGLGNAPSARGQMTVTVPGAFARASGTMAPRSGEGTLQVQWSDAESTRRWISSLPFMGPTMDGALKGASAQGAAQLEARWRGGWQTAVEQVQYAISGSSARTPPRKPGEAFELHARFSTPQLDLQLPSGDSSGSNRSTGVQLRALSAQWSGSLAAATLAMEGEARLQAAQPQQTQRLAVQTRLSGGLVAPGQWRVAVNALRLQAQDAQRPGPWTLQLGEDPLIITARVAADIAVEASAGQARLTGPAPGTVQLHWQPLRVAMVGGGLQVHSQGALEGLPMSWIDALGLGATPAVAGRPAEPLLRRAGLATSIVLNGEWNIDTTTSTPRAQATLRRASGDLRILTGDPTAVTAVQSSGQGKGAGAVTAIATEATSTAAGGTAAGVRTAEVSIVLEGEALRARLQWASERAGEIDATANTRLSMAGQKPSLHWAPDAPLAGTLRASLPDVGVWSALAPPGWRVRGTLQANATLSGTRDAPQWSGTLGADNLAVRSVVEGVDLQDGRLRAVLRGNQIDVTELRLRGGRGSGARIAGFSGNRTAAPQDGGTLTATGMLRWGAAGAGLSGIAMNLQAEANALQVLVRADRQLSVSGQLRAQLEQGQITLRGTLTADRATIILPDESTPRLGSDVVVRSAAKDREDAAKAQAAAKASQTAAARAETAKPPDLAVTFNLGNDFALHGHGITTRLTGEVQVRSSGSTTPGAPPRVTGEVRTDAGRYRAWGQMLDVETGLIRFNGPYDNPSLDILALRPNISVRAGVQVTGSAQAPRVKLYSDPDLPDAEKLSWVVLGRDAAAGGAEAAVLQQAALALLGRGGNNNTAGNFASRVGLDEIGFKGPGTGEDATGAALTFGKRLSKDLYVTYERSLSGTLGTLYIFYDLTRRLTLRGQTGEKSAVDLIYTVKYD